MKKGYIFLGFALFILSMVAINYGVSIETEIVPCGECSCEKDVCSINPPYKICLEEVEYFYGSKVNKIGGVGGIILFFLLAMIILSVYFMLKGASING